MTISNDPNGARSFPKGYDEVKSRTIAPKVKDFNPKLRIESEGSSGSSNASSKPLGERLDALLQRLLASPDTARFSTLTDSP